MASIAPREREALDLLEERLQDAGYRVIPTVGAAVAVEEDQIGARIRRTQSGLRATARLGPMSSWWAYPLLLTALCSGIYRNLHELILPTIISAPAWWLVTLTLLECAAVGYFLQLIVKHRRWMRTLRDRLRRLPV